MIRTFSWLLTAALLGGSALGCGDDDGTMTETDAGSGDDGGGTVTPDNCPADAPDRDQMQGTCCYRVSNADRQEMPEYRLSGLKILSPTSLSNAVVRGLLTSALDEERFNWIFRGNVTGTDVAIETGYGERNADGTFSFVMGTAPAPGEATRWDPITLMGTLGSDEVITSEPFDGALTVPVFDTDGETLTAEFPLRALELNMVQLTEERSCIGERRASSYSTDDALLTSYVTVEDAKGVSIVVGDTLNTTLCMFAAGMSSESGTCDDTPQADWAVPPDSMCDASGCTMGGCDASTCNAWQITGEFSAHAVEITD